MTDIDLAECSDELLFLWAIGKSPPDFAWWQINPEDRPAWARRVVAMEPKDEPGIF